MGRLRRRATIARKAIIQILETAAEYAIEGEEWITLARESEALARALRGVERVDEMEAGVTSLERRQTAARERLETLLGVVESDPKGAENRPHIYNYKPSLDPKKDTVIAAKECSGEGEGPGLSIPGAGAAETAGEGHGARHPPGRAGAADTEAQALSAAAQSRPGRTSSTPPTGCGTTLASRNPSGATPASPWAASWPRWRWRSSRPRRRSISGPPRAATSTAWSPKPKPASCISNARCGPCAAPRSRNAMRAGQGDRIAVTVPGRGEDCHHARPFAAAGSGPRFGGLPTVHSGASGVRPEASVQGPCRRYPRLSAEGGLPSREIPHRRHAPPLPKPRTVSGRYRGPIPGLQ